MPQQSLPTPAEALQGQPAHGETEVEVICCLESQPSLLWQQEESNRGQNHCKSTQEEMVGAVDASVQESLNNCHRHRCVAAASWLQRVHRQTTEDAAQRVAVRPFELERAARRYQFWQGFPLSSASRHGANINWPTVW